MKDLGAAPRLSLDWTSEKAAASLQQVFSYVMDLADEATRWYVGGKNVKRFFARSFRMLSILLGTAAALLPTIGELYAGNGKSPIGAGWTAVLLGIVGALLLLDRFFGFSTGWMRYMASELQIRQMAQEFHLDWEAEKAAWQGNAPSKDQISQMMARCKAFVTQLNNLVREETNAWMKEFESALRQIEESAKSKPAISESGALNLTVTNGDATSNGWTLAIDSGAPETYRGKSARKGNLLPGRHDIRVEGEIGGKTVRAEKVVTVPADGTRDESLTLS